MIHSRENIHSYTIVTYFTMRKAISKSLKEVEVHCIPLKTSFFSDLECRQRFEGGKKDSKVVHCYQVLNLTKFSHYNKFQAPKSFKGTLW